MGMIYMTLNPGDRPTAEDIAEIRYAAQFPPYFDEDSPELTDEQLAEFRPVNTANWHAESASAYAG